MDGGCSAVLHIDELLRHLVEREASDLHLRVGEPPVMRIHGDLTRLGMPPLTDVDMYDLVHPIINAEREVRFQQTMELDISYSVPGLARFRVNIFRQQGHIGAVMRVIPFRIRTIDELGMPPVTKQIAILPRGLVLVTGPTGSVSPPLWPRSSTVLTKRSPPTSLLLKIQSSIFIRTRLLRSISAKSGRTLIVLRMRSSTSCARTRM